MSVFSFAMQMELDGKAYYEEQAARTKVPQLKKLLLELASDEQKHYNMFKALQAGDKVSYDHDTATQVFESTRNVFEQLKAAGEEFDLSGDVHDVWAKAREIEKKSEDFYRQKADELDDSGQKELLNRIADEEHKHWKAIENVIGFLNQPKQWLENAEWADLGDH